MKLIISYKLKPALAFIVLPYLIFTSYNLANAQLADSIENRRAAAQRYMSTSPLEDIFEETIPKIALQMPPSEQDQFIRLMRLTIRIDQLKPAMRDALVRHFTVRELDALAAFYGSREGKSIMRKMGDYMGTVMPLIQAELIRAAQEVSRREK